MAKARAYRYASRAGLLICVLLAIAWVTSLFYWVYLVYARPTSATYWGLTGGGIGCWNMEGFFEVDEHGEFSWEVERIHLGIGWRPFTGTYATFLPLWIPFVLVALATLFFWRRSRRFPPGHCGRCGYDLTGNVSGVCPECGQPVRVNERQASARDE
jgi:hypothetical protein